MDILLSKWVSPHFFTKAVSQQLPGGIEIHEVYQIAPTLPSLQSQVRYAEYQVNVATEKGPEEIEAAFKSLLRLKQLPWQHHRDTGPRRYDLRALINDLWLIDWQQRQATIGMKLRCDNRGSGRPEQVADALGFSHYPLSIHRTKLILRTS
jgi:radical SAM-linked protein